MKHKTLIAALFLLSSITFPFAHEGATGIVLERMEQMKSIAKSMKSIAQSLKQEPLEVTAIAEEAKSIASNSEHVTHMYPADSFYAPSEASLKILDQPEAFGGLAIQMKKEADLLAKMTVTETDVSALNAQFKKLGQSCKACHEKFREKR